MIISKKVYSGAGYLSISILTAVKGTFRSLKSIFLLEKRETLRQLNSGELKERVLFPQVHAVDGESCDFCNKCVKSCPNSSLKIEKKNIVCDTSTCFRCGLCVESCPSGFITMSGDYDLLSESRAGRFIKI